MVFSLNIIMLGRIADHNFGCLRVLFSVCLLIEALNAVQTVSQTSPTLCVEPSAPALSPTAPPLTGTPTNPPFNEGSKSPAIISPVITPPYGNPPFNENPVPPCNEMPIVVPSNGSSDPPPFNEMPIVHPPFNVAPEPSYDVMPIVVPSPPNDDPVPPCKGGNPINVKLENVSPEGNFGVKFSYDSEIDKRMNIMISYDTETAPAATFFKEQLTNSLFQRFTLCGVVQWDIMPCFRSKMKGGQLWCPEGDKQCEFNKIHACVATIYKSNQLKVGSFVICFFTQGNNVQQCAANNGLNYDEIWECASGTQGASDCDECYRHVHGKPSRIDTGVNGNPSNPGIIQPGYGGGFETPSNPGDIVLHTTDSTPQATSLTPSTTTPAGNLTPSAPNSVANQATSLTPSTPNTAGNLTPSTPNSAVNQVPMGVYSPDVTNGSPDCNLDAITDFKNAVCAKLDEGKLQCDYCSC